MLEKLIRNRLEARQGKPMAFDLLAWVLAAAAAILGGFMAFGSEQGWAFPSLILVSLASPFALLAQKYQDVILGERNKSKIQELEDLLAGAAQRCTDLLAGVQANHEANQAEMIQRFINTVERLSAATAGSITSVVRHVHKYKTARGNRDAENAELVRIQQGLLATCVDTVSRWAKLQDLSANWCVRQGDTFSVVTYDKDHLTRHPLTPRPIQSRGGASTAFTTGDISLVDDTSKFPEVFTGNETYKCILSFPASRGVKGPDGVVGVVNIDSPTPGALSEKHALLIADLVSLIALVETEKRAS